MGSECGRRRLVSSLEGDEAPSGECAEPSTLVRDRDPGKNPRPPAGASRSCASCAWADLLMRSLSRMVPMTGRKRDGLDGWLILTYGVLATGSEDQRRAPWVGDCHRQNLFQCLQEYTPTAGILCTHAATAAPGHGTHPSPRNPPATRRRPTRPRCATPARSNLADTAASIR